jgi:hypothetical protein
VTYISLKSPAYTRLMHARPPRTDFEHAFAGGAFLDEGTTLTTTVVPIGQLRVDHGGLIAFDPLSEDPIVHLLDAQLPAGSFPVDTCVVRDRRDARPAVAALRVMFSDARTLTWQAIEDRQDRRRRPAFEYATHTVDSGFSALAGHMPWGPRNETAVSEGISVVRGDRDDFIGVTAGIGQGDEHYASWVGADRDGAIAQLVVDFVVLARSSFAYVDLPLPLADVDRPLFAELDVHSSVRGAATLVLEGDVARIWSAVLCDASGTPLTGLDARVTTSPVPPRDASPFTQLVDVANAPAAAKLLRVRVFTGTRALPRA